MRKRNKLLESYRNETTLKEELSFWNDYLIEQATYITEQRHAYMNYLNARQELESKTFSIQFLANPMTAERLEERYDLDKRVRKTTIGPQKDDFEIFLHDGDTSKNVEAKNRYCYWMTYSLNWTPVINKWL